MKKLRIFLAFMLFVSFQAAAQMQITGTVTGADDGLTLPGVSVTVQGNTAIGTTTDLDGKYSLSVPSSAQVLMFSFVGMTPQEFTIAGQSVINVVLQTDVLSLDEVVVTGVATGTSTKKLGFTVSKVKESQLKEVPGMDAANALRGKVTGVRITQPSGNPGTSAEIRLRGSTSISGSQSPLIIVDGIITEGELSDINMEDVKSIEVVKGAAAASLYGSKAGNGVIQIITKRGIGEDLKVSYRMEYGYSTLAKKYPTSERHSYLLDANGEFVQQGTARFEDPNYMHDNLFPVYYDHQDELFEPQSYITNHVSISQGSKKFNFHTSFQNTTQGGIIEGLPDYERNNVRFNTDILPNDKFKLSISSSYNRTTGYNVTEQSQFDNLFYSVLVADPHVNLFEKNDDGTSYSANPTGYEGNWENPLYVANNQKKEYERDRLLAGIDLSYKLTDWLTFKGQYSIDKSFYEYVNFFPKGYQTPAPSATNNGAKDLTNYDKTQQIMSATAIMRKTFGDYNLGLVLKYQAESYYYDWHRMYADNFAAMGVEDFIGGQDNRFLDSYIEEEIAEDYFVNFLFDYKDKYIFDGLVRQDGSSLFGENERWQTYYRASLAYRITEDFEIPNVQEMKIRASYGVSGQRPEWFGQYETFNVTNTGIGPEILGNKDLKPSEIGELEVGIDVAFFTKYNFIANYSHTVAKDQFILVPLPAYMGFTHQYQNVGEITADAIELSLGGSPVQGDFTWNFNLGWDKITQEISKLDIPDYTRDHVNNSPFAALNLFRVEEGLPYGTMYGNILIESVNDLTVGDDGIVVYSGYSGYTVDDFTTNSDGYVILKGTENTVDEKPILKADENGEVIVGKIGDTNPDFTVGFTNNFSYKGFSLYTLLEWQQGGDIYNYTKQLLYFNDRHGDADEYTELGKKKTYFDASSVLYNKSAAISHFVEDGTYLKIREISLGYNFKPEMLGKLGEYISNLKLSVIGRNLYTFTKYSGFDPEVAISDNPTNFKLDEYSYPNYRTYAVTLQVSF